MLVGIAHHKPYGRTRRPTLEHTTEQFYTVFLLPGGSEPTLAWRSTIQFGLNLLQIDFNTCRHTVYHAADGFSMALAKGSERENMAKRVAHGQLFSTPFLPFFLRFLLIRA